MTWPALEFQIHLCVHVRTVYKKNGRKNSIYLSGKAKEKDASSSTASTTTSLSIALILL